MIPVNSNFHTGSGPSKQKTYSNVNFPFRVGVLSELSSFLRQHHTWQKQPKEAFRKKFNWHHSSKRNSEDSPSTCYVSATLLNTLQHLFLWGHEAVQFWLLSLKFNLRKCKSLGSPPPVIAREVSRVSPGINWVPITQRRWRTHRTIGWRGLENCFIIEGLVPLPCIKANSDGVPNLNHSQGYWLTIFGSYTSHSLIFSLFLSLSFAVWGQKGCTKSGRCDRDQRAASPCLFKVLALGLCCYSHFHPQTFSFPVRIEPWPENFLHSHALLSSPCHFPHPIPSNYVSIDTHTHTHSSLCSHTPLCSRTPLLLQSASSTQREKRKHSDLTEAIYKCPKLEFDLVWRRFQFISFTVTNQYHTRIDFKYLFFKRSSDRPSSGQILKLDGILPTSLLWTQPVSKKIIKVTLAASFSLSSTCLKPASLCCM